MKTSISILSILITGLSSGLFYAWAVSVIPGTRLISDKSYLEAMQSINRAILNPWFLIIFLGTLVLLIWNSYLKFQVNIGMGFYLSLTATIVYLVGTLGVTIAGNVPMNEALDLVQLNQLTTEELSATRLSYEGRWNRLHLIRTIFSVISFLLLILSSHINTSAPKTELF